MRADIPFGCGEIVAENFRGELLPPFPSLDLVGTGVEGGNSREGCERNSKAPNSHVFDKLCETRVCLVLHLQSLASEKYHGRCLYSPGPKNFTESLVHKGNWSV